MNELEGCSAKKVRVWLEHSGLSSLRQRFIGKHLLSQD